MDAQQSDMEATQDRLLKLEKRVNRLRERRIAAPISVALLVLWRFVAAPAQAPGSQAPSSKQAPAADRISALEFKVAALSQRLTFLQKETGNLQILAVARSGSGASTDVSDLREKTEDLDEEMRRIKSDVEDLTNEVASVKSDIPNVSASDVDGLKSDVESLQSFRKAVCSLNWSSSANLTLHGGIYPPCPAFRSEHSWRDPPAKKC